MAFADTLEDLSLIPGTFSDKVLAGQYVNYERSGAPTLAFETIILVANILCYVLRTISVSHTRLRRHARTARYSFYYNRCSHVITYAIISPYCRGSYSHACRFPKEDMSG